MSIIDVTKGDKDAYAYLQLLAGNFYKENSQPFRIMVGRTGSTNVPFKAWIESEDYRSEPFFLIAPQSGRRREEALLRVTWILEGRANAQMLDIAIAQEARQAAKAKQAEKVDEVEKVKEAEKAEEAEKVKEA